MRYIALYLLSVLVAGPVLAGTIRVPEDKSTIQLAINAALPTDIVVVSDGIYSGNGFQDVDFHGKAVVVRSLNGPEATIIDLQSDSTNPHRAFLFDYGADSLTVIDGFTIRNGYGPVGSAGKSVGGAIYCDSLASPTIKDCIFTGNNASGGGAIYSYYASPTFIDCIIKNSDQPIDSGGGICAIRSQIRLVNCELTNLSADKGGSIFGYFSSFDLSSCLIADNYATSTGGAFYLYSSSLLLDSCHVAQNRSVDGGAIRKGTVTATRTAFVKNSATVRGACFYQSRITLDQCTLYGNYCEEGIIATGQGQISRSIIAYNRGSAVVYGHYMEFECTNMYGNALGGWFGEYSDQFGVNGNISVNPEFCDTAAGDLGVLFPTPSQTEPDGCGLQGAYDVGCWNTVLPVIGQFGHGGDIHDYTVRSSTPTFRWSYYDSVPSSQQAYEIQVGTDKDWAEAEMWLSGTVNTADTSTIYSGTPFEDKQTYCLRIRLRSETEWGSWTDRRLVVHLPPDNNGSSDWTTFQGNQQHTGYNDNDRITVPLGLKWSKDFGSRPYISPTTQATIVGDHVYWTGERVDSNRVPWIFIVALDNNTGEIVWQQDYAMSGSLEYISQGTVANGMLLIITTGGGPGAVKFHSLTTGEVLKGVTFSTQHDTPLAPAVGEGVVIFQAGFYGGIASCNSLTAEPLWSRGLGGLDSWLDQWSVTIWDGTAYLFTGGYLRALNIETGWGFYGLEGLAFDHHGYRAAPVLDTINQILYTQGASHLNAMDLNTKSWLWERYGVWGRVYHGDYMVHNPILYNHYLVQADSGSVSVFEPWTGEKLWQLKGFEVGYRLVGANGLVFASNDSTTIAIDMEARHVIWSCPVGGHLSIANNSLYISTDDGQIFCYGGIATDLDEEQVLSLPTTSVLSQNYPNPFNPITTIEYSLPQPADVRLVVYNILGQEVATLVSERQTAGEHVVLWNASSHASGIYFYRLSAGEFVKTKKMVLVK